MLKSETSMLKSETSMLLMNIKTSAMAVLGIIVAFLTPIIPLILIVGAAIMADTLFGVLRANKLKQSITSRKMSKLISKLFLYNGAVVLFFCIEKFILGDIIGAFTAIPLILTKLITATLLFIELTSINENYEAISGVNIWTRFKDMLHRGKELKNDLGDIKDITDHFKHDNESNH